MNFPRRARLGELAVNFCCLSLPALLCGAERVHVQSGDLEGLRSNDGAVRIFKGIPYAAPPLGQLRWQPPQPMTPWTGVRQANEFGARCMQAPIFADMIFRDKGPSEDCLALNVWTPAKTSGQKLPVMFWVYGGGFSAGATSEPRQDGENLAHKGVVVVSMNYRLGVFGFFAHPELTKESPHQASGNYGLLDQAAALQWVHDNIASFGGDPAKITIFGESAGSFSVSALMASPLSKSLIAGAIGESGAFFSATLRTKDLKDFEKDGTEFGKSIGAPSLAALRAKSAQELLSEAGKQKFTRFAPNLDGYFFPKDVYSIYAAGEQSHVPLLAGWNADEGSWHAIFGKESPTQANYQQRISATYGKDSDKILKAYGASSDEELKRAAQDLAGDQFIAFSTWKWIEMQNATGKAPVYRYRFEDELPAAAGEASHGAYHSAEIEFVFNVLKNKKLPWRPEDRKLADIMSSYWSNFATTGNPNGPGLPEWPVYTKDANYPVMHLRANGEAKPDTQRPRYELLDSLTSFNAPQVGSK